MARVDGTMKLQEYLRTGCTPDTLKVCLGIKNRRHPVYPNLIGFEYDQYESPKLDPIVRECRGTILDEAADWAVVARPFNRFFNHGEEGAVVDWGTARVQEKLDGTLIIVYQYDGQWHVATRGSPNAAGCTWDLTPDRPKDFASYFWETLRRATGLDDVQTVFYGNGITYLFELMGPLNRVVVEHGAASVALLGARYDTGIELSLGLAASLLCDSVPRVREFSLTTAEGIFATFEKLSPLQQEGYVVVDENFQRVKVKHPGYVALHVAKDGLSERAFLRIALKGEVPEVIVSFPELACSVGRLEKWSLPRACTATHAQHCRGEPHRFAHKK